MLGLFLDIFKPRQLLLEHSPVLPVFCPHRSAWRWIQFDSAAVFDYVPWNNEEQALWDEIAGENINLGISYLFPPTP